MNFANSSVGPETLNQPFAETSNWEEKGDDERKEGWRLHQVQKFRITRFVYLGTIPRRTFFLS